MLPWTEAQATSFLRMQFTAQHDYYQAQFTGASFDIIELSGNPIGRLYIDRRTDALCVIDLALLPEYRNQGIGTAVLETLLQEAAALGRPVRLHVETFNPAQSLYRRLGFIALETQGIHVLMEWRAPAAIQRNAVPAPLS